MAGLSKLIAGVDVGDRQREEDKADRQHDDVHHGSAPGNDGGDQCVMALAATDRMYSVRP